MEIEQVEISSSGRATAKKDPLETLEWSFNWEDYLFPLGDFIVKAEFLVDGGLEVLDHVVNGYVVTVFVKGGKEGTTCRLGCQITTGSTPAREPVRSIWLKVKSR